MEPRPRRSRLRDALRRPTTGPSTRRATPRSSSRSRPRARSRWSLDTDGEADTGLVLAARRDRGLRGGPDGLRRDAARASSKWRFAAKRKVFTAPAVAPDGRVFFGSQDHHAYALTPQGGPLWSVDLGRGRRRRARASATTARCSSAPTATRSCDSIPDDGHVVWRAKVGGYVRGTLSMTRAGDVARGRLRPDARELVRSRGRRGACAATFPSRAPARASSASTAAPLEDDGRRARSSARRTTRSTRSTRTDSSSGASRPAATSTRPITLLGDGSVVFGSDDGKVYHAAGAR